MIERKSYFVTVDTEDIREFSLPESGIEYEIIATPDEVKEIEELFTEKDKDGRGAVGYLKKPFDEWGADDSRSRYNDHLLKIYRRIYDFGTAETKEKIKQLELF